MIWDLGSIFYIHSIVGNNTYSIYTKMGGTLPAFKYEIEDFFFTRLGTGRTSQCRPATSCVCNIIHSHNFIAKITANKEGTGYNRFLTLSLMFFNPDDNFFQHYCEFFSCKFACRVVHFFSLSFNKSDFCHCNDSIFAPCRQCVEVFV